MPDNIKGIIWKIQILLYKKFPSIKESRAGTAYSNSYEIFNLLSFQDWLNKATAHLASPALDRRMDWMPPEGPFQSIFL